LTTWLVTGGAGYIGAHVVRSLQAAGVTVAVLDDLSTGFAQRLLPQTRLIVGSLLNPATIWRAFDNAEIDGVVHLAAKKSVPESLAQPLRYYQENVTGFQVLLQAVTQARVPRLLLSSSAAVYGTTSATLVSEDSPAVPTNPYGFTKLVCERMLDDVAKSTGLRWVALRYFNVAGAGSPALGDKEASNLIPMVLSALRNDQNPEIFGDDYPTPDGTCERDFIHVDDLAEAHVLAAAALQDGTDNAIYNVGRGQGASVREVIDLALKVTGIDKHPKVRSRRPGDPPRVVADPSRIHRNLSWTARHGLEEMVCSTWAAGFTSDDDDPDGPGSPGPDPIPARHLPDQLRPGHPRPGHPRPAGAGRRA
jgi:UDP-glucose 4-epimerase